MNFLSAASYYLQYFYFNRGDSKILQYFSSNEFNAAIKELTQEGYLKARETFIELARTYSLTTPLNKEESEFINDVKIEYLTNKKNLDAESYFLSCNFCVFL